MAKGNYTSKVAASVQTFTEEPVIKPIETTINISEENIIQDIQPKEKEDDILSGLKKRRKKINHSFYLEEEVYQNLLIFAKKHEVSPSEYVNALIKKNI